MRFSCVSSSLVLTVLVLALTPIPDASANDARRPNVLFISVDDLRPELGCYGNAHIKSPHIDRLAWRGVTFTRAYCQLAVCNPSRVSLMTGLRPDSTKVWDLVTQFRQTIPDVVTLPQQFKKHGYHAVSYGKILHNPWPDNAGAAENKERLSELSRQMWAALPNPPTLTPPTLTPTKPRGPLRIRFKNLGDVRLNLFSIMPDGTEQKLGVLQPDGGFRLISRPGQRYRVRGPDGFSETFEVSEQPLIFEIKPEPRATEQRQPNIVFCMADDWSWPHAGILGDPVVKTPNFDRVATEGVLFENAFVSTPSCTPSRLSILTGQHHWRLQEGDSLGGSLREEYDVYTDLLEKAGYRVGRFGKGVWPSKHTFRKRDSFGEKFSSFAEFLKERKPNEPFCYWHGGQDPHRPYELGVGVKSGINLSDVKVPACLPNSETVRSDVADYFWEVQRFDSEVGEIIAQLKAMGELENTIIVVSGDNGMPFPRCKATLYDQGTRVPLAIRWGAKVEANRKVTDFVSLCDMAPTFLEAAGLKPSEQMIGRSLMPVLKSAKSGQIDSTRTFALSGMEQHVYSYPSRALRTQDFLYIRNFGPDQWPMGEVEGHNPQYDFAVEPWPTESGAFSFNIDPSPSKQFLRLHRNEEGTKRFADMAFLRHPVEELYDLRKDPDQLVNVAGHADYAKIKQRLLQKLDAELIRSDDPRLVVKGCHNRVIEGWPLRISDELLAEQPEATKVARAVKKLKRCSSPLATCVFKPCARRISIEPEHGRTDVGRF